MKPLLKILLARGLSLLAWGIVLFALSTLLLRATLPHADGLRGQVTAGLGELLGVQVQVSELKVRLRDLRPQLSLTDARLMDRLSGEPLLGLRALDIDLDLAATLVARRPRIDGITLVGAEIEVRRGADGRIGIRGLDGLRGDDTAALDFFLREGRFSLRDSTLYWTDALAGLPALALVVEQLDFINTGRQHGIRLLARPPGDPDGRLQLLARLEGAAGRPEDWTGPVYASWQGTDIMRPLRQRLPAALKLSSRELAIQSWLQLDEDGVTEVLADLRIQRLRLARGADAPAVAIGDLTALARWRRQTDGWQLQVADLSAFGPVWQRDRTDAALMLRRAPGDGGARLVGEIGNIGLQPLATLAGLLGDELPAIGRELIGQRIDGRLSDAVLRIDLPPAGNEPLDWRLRASVDGLGLSAVGPVPAVDGLDLRVDTGPDHGSVEIDASDTTIDLRPGLAEPTRLTRLAGRFQWRRMPAGSIHLWTDALTADTADLGSVSRLSICAHPSGTSPFIDLHSHFTNGDAEAMGRYLPVAVMKDELVDWLNRAVVSGRLESGDLLLRGPIDRFPFDDQTGRFILELRVRDGILDYQPPRPLPPDITGLSDRDRAQALGWPRLEEIAATLRFENRSLTIDVEQARVLGAEVTGGSATLPDLWNPRWLLIRARGRAPLSDGLRVLAETPLSYRLGGIARALSVTGRGGLELSLDLPLNKTLDLRFAGSVLFANSDDAATVELDGIGLRLTGLDGKLDFDNAGVSAEDVRADLDGQPLRIGIATRGDGDQGQTELQFSGETSVAELRRRFPSRFWALASGQLDWQVAAVLNNADASERNPPLDLTFSSDLAGLALALPAPLGKPADTERALSAEMRLESTAAGGTDGPGRGAGPFPLRVGLGYGDAGALLELTRDATGRIGVARAAIEAGARPQRLPAQRGLSIDGVLPALDLRPWIEWVSTNGGLFEPEQNRRARPEPLPLLPSQLGVENLRLGPLRLREVQAGFRPGEAGGWSIRFESAANGGRVDLPATGTNGTLSASLDTLDILSLATEPNAGNDAGRRDPRGIGPLALTIDELRVGDKPLGRLSLATQSIPRGVRLSELSLDGPAVDLTGDGEWTMDATGYEQTRIELRAQTGDLGELLRRLDYYGDAGGAPGRGTLSLTWPGGPNAFDLARARGNVDIDLAEGRLLTLDPGVGRMLGALNVGALQRRLSLDFSDIFDEGFTFDTIKARLSIGSGLARIGQLEILAAPADIRITGAADLIDKTLDQTVQVTPKIGTGVALASIVAGGPLVGAAVFLADKAAGDAVDRLARYEYRVTGPWRDPVIRRTGSTLIGTDDETSPVPDRPAAATPPRGARPAPQSKPADDNPFLEGF